MIDLTNEEWEILNRAAEAGHFDDAYRCWHWHERWDKLSSLPSAEMDRAVTSLLGREVCLGSLRTIDHSCDERTVCFLLEVHATAFAWPR